jgi:hypothetical protein
MLARLRQLVNGRTPARRTMRSPCRLGLEPLEERSLPSFTASPVNASARAAGDQYESAVAARGGRNVVVWTDYQAATGKADIKARVYAPDAVPTTRWIGVTSTPALESDPAVAMDADGDFVVVWNEEGSIKGARYSGAGPKLGNTFTIAAAQTLTIPVSPFGDTVDIRYFFAEPSVAMDAAGNCVVTARDSFFQVSAVMYAADGSFTRSFSVGIGQTPAVARNADGRFAIAYDSVFPEIPLPYRGEVLIEGIDREDRIELQTFSIDGTRLGTYAVTQPAPDEDVDRPTVAIDDRGNCVVAYERWYYRHYQLDTDVLARTVSSAGALSYVMPISTTPLPETSPVVAMDRSDGDFVVAYEGNLGPYFGGRRVVVDEMSATGTRKASYDAGATNLSQPAICINERDEYYLTFTAMDWADPLSGALDPGQGVVMRRGRLV